MNRAKRGGAWIGVVVVLAACASPRTGECPACLHGIPVARDGSYHGHRVGWRKDGIDRAHFERDCLEIHDALIAEGKAKLPRNFKVQIFGPADYLRLRDIWPRMLALGYQPTGSDACEPWQYFP